MYPGKGRTQPGRGGIPPAASHPPVVEPVRVTEGSGARMCVVTIADGEDVVLSIRSAHQIGPQDVAIMCCFGYVSKPTICSPGPNAVDRTYEGRFQISLLNGILTWEENGLVGGGIALSIAMDDHVIGGMVTGRMIAAGPVQVTLSLRNA